MRINQTVTNPGELNTSIALQTRAVASDAGAFGIQSWTTVATVWAKWRNLHGAEVWAAQSIGAEGAATVTIRYRAVDETYAILYGGERYEIVSVDNIQEHGEYIELKVRRMREG